MSPRSITPGRAGAPAPPAPTLTQLIQTPPTPGRRENRIVEGFRWETAFKDHLVHPHSEQGGLQLDQGVESEFLPLCSQALKAARGLQFYIFREVTFEV